MTHIQKVDPDIVAIQVRIPGRAALARNVVLGSIGGLLLTDLIHAFYPPYSTSGLEAFNAQLFAFLIAGAIGSAIAFAGQLSARLFGSPAQAEEHPRLNKAAVAYSGALTGYAAMALATLAYFDSWGFSYALPVTLGPMAIGGLLGGALTWAFRAIMAGMLRRSESLR